MVNWPASHGPFWPKLIMPLATIFVEIFLKEKNWIGFRPYLVTLGKEFEYLLKNNILKIFERVNCPGQFSGSCPNEMIIEHFFAFSQYQYQELHVRRYQISYLLSKDSQMDHGLI